MRFSRVVLMSILSGLLLAIIGIPISFLIFPHHGPKDEFTGIAILGGIFIVSGIAMVIGCMAGAFLAIVYDRNETEIYVTRAMKILGWSIGLTVVAYLVAVLVMR
jgi:hypothetical protein